MESMNFVSYRTSNPTEKTEISFITLTDFITWCTTRGYDVIVRHGRRLEILDLE